MIGSLSSVATATLWVLVAIGAVFSVWVWWTGRRELDKAGDFREEILELFAVDPNAPAEPDYGEQIGKLTEHMNSMTVAFNESMTVLQKLPGRMDGATGRASQLDDKQKAEFFTGLDLMADQTLVNAVPMPWRVAAQEVLDSGDPRLLGYFREWALNRPEIQMLIAGQQTPGSGPAGPHSGNPIDRYIS